MSINFWLLNLAGALGVSFLLFLITKGAKTILTPAHCFSAVWGVTLLISQVALEGLIRPHMSTIMVMYGAWWALLIGSLIPLCHTGYRPQLVSIRKTQGIIVLIGLLALQCAGILYEIETFSLLTNFRDLPRHLIALRLEGAFLDVQLPPFLGAFRWGHTMYIPLTMILLHCGHISKKIFGLILVFAVFSTLLHFTRAPFVQLFAVCLVSWLVIFQPTRRAILVLFGAVSLLVMLFFVSTQGMLLNLHEGNPLSLGESLLSYFGISPRAYEVILLGEFPRESGYYTLDAMYFFLKKLNLVSDYPGLSRPYVYTPLETNLYTFLDTFTLDFGVIGALIGAGCIGLVSSRFYLRAKSIPTVFNITVYAYLFYGCLMAPANNEFIRFTLFLNAVIAWCIYQWTRTNRGPIFVFQLNIKKGAKGFPVGK